MTAPLEIAVIGGGIGGLSAAVALRQAGFVVEVYEQAAELTQIGGGINMASNAVRVLYRLGLREGLDREPLPRWSVGRASLLGDACHPTYPFMGQGAAQAIEDGAALAACLAAGADDPAAALRRYEELRLPRATRLQQMSRANRTRFHMRDGPEQQARDAEWAKTGDRSPDALRWLYAFDASRLAPPA